MAVVRPEVERLLDLLDELIVANGSKKPTRSKKNLDAARLMLDADGRSVAEVEGAIRWSQADPFWRSNILSMSKLRERYDQLRLAAQRQRSPASTGPRKLTNAELALAELADERSRG